MKSLTGEKSETGGSRRLFFIPSRISRDFWYISGTLFVAFILFWFLFPLYSYDSSWYLSFLEYFSGNEPFSKWNPIRGFTFPFILWIAHLIKAGSWGVEIVLCFFYLLWGSYLFKILKLIKKRYLKAALNICDCVLVFVLALMSSIIWGYFHFVLTECISVSLQTVYAYYAIKFYMDRKEQTASKKDYLLFLLLSCVMTILFWFLKQSFVTNTILLIAAFELLTWIDKFALKKILYSAVLVICVVGSLKSGITLWDHVIDAKENPTIYFANRFNMMRYIVVSSRSNGGTVSVMSDDWEVIDTFEYEYENNLLGVIKFWGTCFVKYPGRVLSGYIDNYLLMADIYQHKYRSDLGAAYAYGPVVRNRIWETVSGRASGNIAGENAILVRNSMRVRYDASEAMETNTILLERNGYPTSFMKNYTNINRPNLVTFFITSTVYWTFTSLIYAFLLVTAPFVFIAGFVLYLKRKNAIVGVTFALSFYAFFFVLMHVVEGMPIDRYAVPAYGIMLIVLIMLFCALIDKLKTNCFKKNKGTQGIDDENISNSSSL